MITRDIEQQPATMRTSTSMTRPSGFPIDIQATLQLVVRRPDLLEEVSPGIVSVDGKTFAPSLVQVVVPQRSLSTPEHRRLLAFVLRLWVDARTAELSGLLDKPGRDALIRLRSRLVALREATFLRQVEEPEDDLSILDPTPLEAVDERYAAAHRLRIHYLWDVSPGIDVPSLTREHFSRADDIFQAYCCYLVAAAFNLKPVGARLRERDTRGVSFANEEWELFYDVAGTLESWRAQSRRPDDYRPDILLRRCADPTRIIAADAKYSVDIGTAGGDQLKEVQAYLNSFGIKAIAVLFPVAASAMALAIHDDVSGDGNLIRLIPIGPLTEADEGTTLSRLRTSLLSLETDSTPAS